MYFYIIFTILLSISLIYIQSKYSFLTDKPENQQHKLSQNKNVPLSGGLFFFASLLISSLLTKYHQQNLMINMFLFLFLILGIYSDLKINFSPKLRFFLQAILVILTIIIIDLRIDKTNVVFLDLYINNDIFNLIFTTICILVLINGSNFCDGINCNVAGYYLIVALAIFLIDIPLPATFISIEKILTIFLVFYILNLFQKSFLGDNGVYVISIFMSIYVIEFINMNNNVSSLLALNLLWYPAFENLFTIIRRVFSKKSIQIADRYHLHILIFEEILNKDRFIISNSLTGVLLNIFMLSGIFLSINFSNNGKLLMLILTVNIALYIGIYYFLFLRKKKLDLDKKEIKQTDNKTETINK